MDQLYQGPVTPCGQGFGMAVSTVLGVVVVTNYLDSTLSVYRM